MSEVDKAPERIWLCPQNYEAATACCHPSDAEYIRADLVNTGEPNAHELVSAAYKKYDSFRMRPEQRKLFAADIAAALTTARCAERDALLARVRELEKVLTAAVNAMRSYQFGNESPDLANQVAEAARTALAGSDEGKGE
jgi:hypothetical protein